MSTLERLALAKLRERFPGLQRRGFSAAVRAVDPDIDREGRVAVIPDGWFIEKGSRKKGFDATLTCVEIEDGNPLTADKLYLYCDLWDTLEYYYHDLRLFVFDRYGLNQRELDLGSYFDFLGQRALNVTSGSKGQFRKSSNLAVGPPC